MNVILWQYWHSAIKTSNCTELIIYLKFELIFVPFQSNTYSYSSNVGSLYSKIFLICSLEMLEIFSITTIGVIYRGTGECIDEPCLSKRLLSCVSILARYLLYCLYERFVVKMCDFRVSFIILLLWIYLLEML